MKCPACNTELRMTERQSVEIDYCPACRGIWLDRGELDKLLERSRMEQRYQIDDDDSDDDHRRDRTGRSYPPDAPPQPPTNYQYHKKKKSFWGEIFDFD